MMPNPEPTNPDDEFSDEFTLEQARALMPELRERAAIIMRLRADLADLSHALRVGRPSGGGVAEAKALEAHLQEALSWFTARGIDVKGVAPLLLDFPSRLNGESVQLCWLEGDVQLAWYHRTELGFAGRRPIPEI